MPGWMPSGWQSRKFGQAAFEHTIFSYDRTAPSIAARLGRLASGGANSTSTTRARSSFRRQGWVTSRTLLIRSRWPSAWFRQAARALQGRQSGRGPRDLVPAHVPCRAIETEKTNDSKMPNDPTLDASVQWRIDHGTIDLREPGYRGTAEAILDAGLATEVRRLISAGKEADVYLCAYNGAPLAVKAYRLYRTSHRGGRPIK